MRRDRFPRDFYAPKSFCLFAVFRVAEVCTGGLESPIVVGGALATLLALGLADLAA